MWFFPKLHLLYILGFGPKSKNYGSSTLIKYSLNGRNYPHPCKTHDDCTRLGQKRLQTHFWALPSRRRYMTNTHVWEDITQKRHDKIQKTLRQSSKIPSILRINLARSFPNMYWSLETYLKSASDSVWSINQGLISCVNFTLQA